MVGIDPAPRFRREFKRLSKKYRSLGADVASLARAITANPQLGESLGNNCYKSVLPSQAKAKVSAAAPA